MAFVAGVGLGLFYFGGLWLTVRRLTATDQPALLMLASMLVRTAVLLGGFWLVMDYRIDRLLACLVGLLVMRTLLVRRLRPGGGTGGERAAIGARGSRAP